MSDDDIRQQLAAIAGDIAARTAAASAANSTLGGPRVDARTLAAFAYETALEIMRRTHKGSTL